MAKLDDKIAKLVARQIDGNADQRYISEIFLSIRYFTFGTETIRELADFEAHREERTKGLVTERCRDFFFNMQAKWSQIINNIPSHEVPKHYARVLISVFRDLSNQDFRAIGYDKKSAYRLLQSSLSKIEVGAPILQMYKKLTRDEARVVHFCSQFIIVNPVFEQSNLFTDYCFVLKKNGLIEDKDVSKLSYLSEDLMLYAIELMNKKTIRIEEGYTASLSFDIDTSGKLSVGASAQFEQRENTFGYISTPILETEMDSFDFVNSSLYDSDTNKPSHHFFKEGISVETESSKRSSNSSKFYTSNFDIIVEDRKICHL